jgi:uncharacterized protein involved in tolerance to divalent cations
MNTVKSFKVQIVINGNVMNEVESQAIIKESAKLNVESIEKAIRRLHDLKTMIIVDYPSSFR